MEKLICPGCKAELTGVGYIKTTSITKEGKLFDDGAYETAAKINSINEADYFCPHCHDWLGSFGTFFKTLAEFILAYKEREKRRQTP